MNRPTGNKQPRRTVAELVVLPQRQRLLTTGTDEWGVWVAVPDYAAVEAEVEGH